MKKILLISAILTCSSAVYAQTTSGSNSQANSGSVSVSGGNSQNITFTSPANTTTTATATVNSTSTSTVVQSGTTGQDVNYSGNYTVKNVPSMNGPALTSSNDTCMGSSSGALSIAGFGLGGGTTWVDTNCKMLKNSRELWNMGMKAAALALMCTDKANREALELTDFECPQTTKAKKENARKIAETGYTGNDPIVRARLGMSSVDAGK